jgi:hypothetical protein
MGYYTRYKLSVKNHHPQYEEFVKWIESSPKTSAGYKWKQFWEGNAEPCKWYEYDNDMPLLSQQFPELVFMLEGEGEEGADLWRRYYKNGKVQIANAKIVYDEYDESKLEVPKKGKL